MGFIEIKGIAGVPDCEAVPAGEYQLQVLDAKFVEVTDKPNRKTGDLESFKRLDITYRPIAGPPDVNIRAAKLIYHWVYLWHSNDADMRAEDRLRGVISFGAAHGQDVRAQGGLDWEQLKGVTVWALLELRSDPTYGESNSIRRFMKAS